MSAAGSARPQYQYTLTSTDFEELNHWAPIIEQTMAKLPGLQDVDLRPADRLAAPRHRHRPRHAPRGSACRSRQIDQTLYDAFGQRQVATIYTSSTQYKVVLEVLP